MKHSVTPLTVEMALLGLVRLPFVIAVLINLGLIIRVPYVESGAAAASAVAPLDQTPPGSPDPVPLRAEQTAEQP